VGKNNDYFHEKTMIRGCFFETMTKDALNLN